jgi:hypothetical protein
MSVGEKYFGDQPERSMKTFGLWRQMEMASSCHGNEGCAMIMGIVGKSTATSSIAVDFRVRCGKPPVTAPPQILRIKDRRADRSGRIVEPEDAASVPGRLLRRPIASLPPHRRRPAWDRCSQTEWRYRNSRLQTATLLHSKTRGLPVSRSSTAKMTNAIFRER